MEPGWSNIVMCGNCDADRVRDLPIGKTYQLRCPRCCDHSKGGWILTEAFAGWKRGYVTEACANGCGAILSQVKLDDVWQRMLRCEIHNRPTDESFDCPECQLEED